MTTKITRRRMAGEDHAVVTVVSDGKDKHTYRRTPCSDCPWRLDAVGVFPAEAFRHSAPVAYDMSPETFGCHASGQKHPATCAGFLLRAHHNLAVRMDLLTRRIGDDVTDGGVDLFDDYRAMAIANGVDPDDPVLAPCR